VIATGITPRVPSIPGLEGNPRVVSYLTLLKEGLRPAPGSRIAIIGAGGIGFDVAAFLSEPQGEDHFYEEWGIDHGLSHRGGLSQKQFAYPRDSYEITMLQRKDGKMGGTLGKTTGWIHRALLKKRKVKMRSGVSYSSLDDQGLWVEEKNNKTPSLIPADLVVVCAGQKENRSLYDLLILDGEFRDKLHLIGGAFEAKELDAKAAISQGMKVAMSF
jgi:2,4-dienoyl-CoA reductase (NADPH2)